MKTLLKYARVLLFSILRYPLVLKLARFINKLGGVFPPQKIIIDGQVFSAQKPDRLLALFLLKHKALEKGESYIFNNIIQKGWTVVDIGANLGYYTIRAARLVGNHGKVIAFEPEEENFHFLEKNIRANKYTQIQALPWAVSDISGTTQIYISEENSGDHRIYNTGANRNKREINTTSLDDFFKPGDRINFIKMDIQGAEFLALKGMKRVLNDNPEIIIMSEFWPEGLTQSGSSPQEFLRALQQHGFFLAYIDEKTNAIIKSSPEELMTLCGTHGYANLLLRRN
ncbi:MAG: FkbM family methyltransferase [Patescibacteria group bacterium]